jgi:RNA polymerase sigma-70 factor, ECF subfamily
VLDHGVKDEVDVGALDACQDVFVRLIERRGRFDAQYPSSLLYRIAKNVCLNRIRDRGRRPEDPYDEKLQAIACLEEPGGISQARLLLDWLFARHPASSRTMAGLHDVDGRTLDQVAAESGLSVSGVRKRLNRLRQDVER